MRLGGRFQDALLAVLALLQVGRIFEGAAGRKSLAGIVVELVDNGAGGCGRGGGRADILLLFVYSVLVVRPGILSVCTYLRRRYRRASCRACCAWGGPSLI